VGVVLKYILFLLLAFILLAFPINALSIEDGVNISNNISSWEIHNIDNIYLDDKLVVLNNTVLFDDLNVTFFSDYPSRDGKAELLLYEIDNFFIKGDLFHLYYYLEYDRTQEYFVYNGVNTFDSFTLNDGFLSLTYRHI